MRFVRTLISLGFAVFGAAVLAVVLAAYLTATGHSGPVLRMAAARAGQLFAGQSIERLALTIAADPSRRSLDGVAHVDLRVEAPRRYVYFFLNDGLRVRQVWRQSPGGDRLPLHSMRLWILTVVDLGEIATPDASLDLVVAYGGDPTAGLVPFGDRILDADEIVLSPMALWYPTDTRSFISISVDLTLPARLTPVHNGTPTQTHAVGDARRFTWTTDRAVPGLALVAGRHRQHQREDAGNAFRALVASGIDLDPETVSQSMADAASTIGAVCGPPPTSRMTLFISRHLRRPLADGSGVFGLPVSPFSAGDYGYAAVAEAVARSWWGGALAADPLRPTDAGAWVIDGFAAETAAMAVRERFGDGAEIRWRAGRATDPNLPDTPANFSVLDAELDAARAQAMRHRAGAVVTMLRDRLGDEGFAAAVRRFLDDGRGRHATVGALRAAFAELTDAEWESFSARWLTSASMLDLSLEPNQGEATLLDSHGGMGENAAELWRIPPGGEPVVQRLAGGGVTPVGNAERLVADPRGRLPDMVRFNNVLPRETAPRSVARSLRGAWMVVDGEPHPWAPARVREIDAAGQTRHVWEFDRGILGQPQWSAGGTHILVAEPARGSTAKLFSLHPSDGSRSGIGEDTVVAGGAGGYAAARGRFLIWVEDKSEQTLVALDAGAVGNPILSPDGANVAYTVNRPDRIELRARPRDGGIDQLLAIWNSPPRQWQWAPDGTRLFALLAGDWDWQLWELPVDTAPRALMREAAGARAMAVAPDGRRVALVAQANLDYRFEKYDVFVLDPNDPAAVQRFTAGGQSVIDLAWIDDASLLLIATDPALTAIPTRRELARLDLADGSLTPLQ